MINKLLNSLLSFSLLLLIGACTDKTHQVWLDDLDIKSFSESIPAVVAKATATGKPMMMNGVHYERGIGAQITSVIPFLLDGHAKEFTAVAGVDDIGIKGVTVRFYVIGDRKILYDSGDMTLGDAPKEVKVGLKGIKRMGLLIIDNTNERSRTYCNWANAKIEMYENHLPEHIPNDGERYILTPQPSPSPKINSPSVFGATPGNSFLYTIAATGNRPMNFAVENLPRGLSLDPKTGIITGKVKQRGVYKALLKAKNDVGEATKELTIKIGDTIALTPPIGWNGWNSWARNIDREKVIASAEAMVRMGLSNHGWMYINIDDAWQGQRGGKYNAIQPNEKFPKFKEMIDYIHSLGLKTGVYSTPWITSYAGYVGGSSDFENGFYPDSIVENKRAHRRVGKYRFETNDALQMADWGVDYLKYDWRIDLTSAERMSEALRKSGRDILLSLSNSAPFDLAGDWARLANTYRTGPDIRDSWTSLYISAFTIDKWAPYAGPGHWNDPDMLVIGNISTGMAIHPTRLTPDEQYAHVSIFSLLAAPLLIGCPIEQLDDFTLNLITNDELIAINQDPLGKAARLKYDEDGIQAWVKPLEDGSLAVGMFYTDDFGKTQQSYFRWGDESAKTVTLDFKKIGIDGTWKIRDVWRQKDLGEFRDSFSTQINHHGVVLIRMVNNK